MKLLKSFQEYTKLNESYIDQTVKLNTGLVPFINIDLEGLVGFDYLFQYEIENEELSDDNYTMEGYIAFLIPIIKDFMIKTFIPDVEATFRNNISFDLTDKVSNFNYVFNVTANIDQMLRYVYRTKSNSEVEKYLEDNFTNQEGVMYTIPHNYEEFVEFGEDDPQATIAILINLMMHSKYEYYYDSFLEYLENRKDEYVQ